MLCISRLCSFCCWFLYHLRGGKELANKKYELTDEAILIDDTELRRIRALCDSNNVKVNGSAKANGKAKVPYEARIFLSEQVTGGHADRMPD